MVHRFCFYSIVCIITLFSIYWYADHTETPPELSEAYTWDVLPEESPTIETTNEQEVSMGWWYDDEFLQALDWMHNFWLTRFDKPETFRPYDILSRQEAAKFFSQFAKEILYRTLDQTKYCYFDDMEWVDPSLKNYIIESCLLHMFWWSWGYFFPFDTFTKGQALAVLMRWLDGYKDESGTYRWWAYRQQAWEAWLTKDANISHWDKAVTRYEVALLLYRAAQRIQK
jgi:hypothetical protein